MYDETYDWRYATSTDVNGHITVTRGRPYRMGSADGWTYYWESDGLVAFYDEGFSGCRVVTGTDDEGGARAIAAHKNGDGDALQRLAIRITGNDDANFICVGLDRGIDLYALSWDGDADGTWRDEIEAVWNHEVYRMETNEYVLTRVDSGIERWEWLQADDFCEEYYGSDNAEAGQAKEFPLSEFPAELFVTGSD